MFQPIAADVRQVARARVGVADLRLREGALRLRLEAHLEAGQPQGVGVPVQHLQVVRLRARVSVVRTARRPRRQDRQRDRHAARHGRIPISCTSSAATTTRSKPDPAPTTTRRGPRRCSKRRACSRTIRCRRRSSSPRSPAKKAACSAAASSSAAPSPRKMHVVGALNNDMVGWTNDARLDNTIRYSNPGIRDIQHGAAMLFTRLITYDALYFKGTDAASLYDAYGDVIGGIGSYPVLGSPHYHQAERSAGVREPPAHPGNEQDDGGDDDAAGVEPVAADEPEGGQLHWRGRVAVVDAESRSRGSRRTSSPTARRPIRCATA